ncbi:MAG: hypothetical protein IJ859_08335, partial [Synergistaceae bacterium]|nr:hypothetical protein [Synergistaceae bacterium]
AVLTSPALEVYRDYKIVQGASLSGMDGKQYYVAGDIGDEASQATLNLGLSEEFDVNSSFAVVNVSTNRVVFAYDPNGEYETWKTGGNISLSGGRLFTYNSLTIEQNENEEYEGEYYYEEDEYSLEDNKYIDADILSVSKQTDKGITALNIGTGSNLSFVQQDTDPKARNVSPNGNVFRLDRKINTFSGMTH